MKVRLRLFAVAKQLAGSDLLVLEVPDGATVGQLREQLSADVPALALVVPHVLFALGSDYVRDDQMIPADREMACIPPVSGG